MVAKSPKIKLASALLVICASALTAPADEPYKRMFDDTLEFTGTESLADGEGAALPIVIGLFTPGDDDHPIGSALTGGATLAVEQVNLGGGIDGRPIRLVRRWADDPWGSGASEVVKLVFEDRAWAIIGGPDGASTHIAQQVATKAHIPLIAPVASDPSLTHTRVPWILRLPPDDGAQAELLTRVAVNEQGMHRLGLVTSTDHDSRIAAAELVTALADAGRPPVFHLEIGTDVGDCAAIADRVAAFETEALVLRLPAGNLRTLISALAGAGLTTPVFIPWVPGFNPDENPLIYPGPVWIVAPFNDAPESEFSRSYFQRLGEKPPPEAAYGYDAVNLIVTAARSGATGRAGLQRLLADAGSYSGASGVIEWDAGGGNTARPVMAIHRPSRR